ncbi:hypothetical protein QTP88_026034 [Uroleucon formosanum]
MEATILKEKYKGEDVLIPCIPMIPTDVPFEFKRLQFPVRLTFAMSINKSQGQSLSVCGINLENPCFSHGQLYVACSPVGKPSDLIVYAPAGWFETLQQFDFDIKFWPGTWMAYVDTLSRVEPPSTGVPNISVDTELIERLNVFITMTVTDRVRFMQQEDNTSKELIEFITRSGTLTDHEKRMVDLYEVHHSISYRRYSGRLLLVIPKAIRKE